MSIVSFRLFRPTPWMRNASARAIQVLERTARPVETPHHERIAGAQMVECVAQAKPVG